MQSPDSLGVQTPQVPCAHVWAPSWHTLEAGAGGSEGKSRHGTGAFQPGSAPLSPQRRPRGVQGLARHSAACKPEGQRRTYMPLRQHDLLTRTREGSLSPWPRAGTCSREPHGPSQRCPRCVQDRPGAAPPHLTPYPGLPPSVDQELRKSEKSPNKEVGL